MALITYDVSAKHIEVKAAMLEKGYSDSWVASGIKYWLPNTTLWNQNVDTTQALTDLQAVTTYLRTTLQRAIAVPSNPWSGIVGLPHE